MKRIAALALLLTLAGSGVAATPEPAPAPSPEADAAVGAALDALGYTYEVDEDGDYRMVFDTEGDRTQLVFVRSTVETYGDHAIREIWSPGYTAQGDSLPAEVANRLLADSQDSKLGGWVRQGGTAMFVVKIDATTPGKRLADAIDAAVRTADAMENELTGTDEF